MDLQVKQVFPGFQMHFASEKVFFQVLIGFKNVLTKMIWKNIFFIKCLQSF